MWGASDSDIGYGISGSDVYIHVVLSTVANHMQVLAVII